MVDTQERERLYTTERDSGPLTAAVVVLLSLLIVVVIGFVAYFFGNSMSGNQSTLIERNTESNTSNTVPVPLQSPAGQTLNNNMQLPPANSNSTNPSNSSSTQPAAPNASTQPAAPSGSSTPSTSPSGSTSQSGDASDQSGNSTP